MHEINQFPRPGTSEALGWELVSWGLHKEDPCYGLNVYVPHLQIHMLKPYPQCDGVWEVTMLT